MGFSDGPEIKNPPVNAVHVGFIPGQEEPLEKEILSRTLAWEIPWTEEPGGLHSMGSQKIQTQLSD